MYISVSMQQFIQEEFGWLANVLKVQYVRAGQLSNSEAYAKKKEVAYH